MSRTLTIIFDVDDETISSSDLYELAERIVAQIDPDPPVLTYHGVEIQRVQA